MVKLINVNIKDLEIAKIARLSHGKFDINNELTRDDFLLFNNLWKWGHYSVFEFQQLIFYVKVPIFTARQWMRHRTGSFLEKSLRYTKLDDDSWAYTPQTENNMYIHFHRVYQSAISTYEFLIANNVPPEDARVVLPMGIYTEFYWRVDARNLFNFLKLRFTKHAQKDIRENAEQILDELYKHPYTVNLYYLFAKELGVDTNV
jgi:thymidylate synthase (FAD)